MPNGGVHHCWGCYHHNPDKSFCNLRNIPIESDRWTTCRNRNNDRDDIDGPMFAIVCEVKSGAGGYGDIPYFNGCRADTVQDGAGDTVVRFTDHSGKLYEFATVAEYMDFYHNSGREL